MISKFNLEEPCPIDMFYYLAKNIYSKYDNPLITINNQKTSKSCLNYTVFLIASNDTSKLEDTKSLTNIQAPTISTNSNFKLQKVYNSC